MGKKKDIKEKRYGKLVAIEPTKKKSKQNSIIWLFKCDCGKYVEIPLNEVTRKQNPTQSCGCSKNSYIGSSEHGKKMYSNIGKQYVMGTAILKINREDENLQTNNTSGYQGVSYIRTRKIWRAELRFQGSHVSKDCHSFEEAVKVRKIMRSERDKFLQWWNSLTEEEQKFENEKYKVEHKTMASILKNRINNLLEYTEI